MKTKSFFILMLIFIPLLMNSQNYFTDGMRWRTQISGTHKPEIVTLIEVVTIEKTMNDNCFYMYRSYENGPHNKELIALIKTEESKVYFQLEKSNSSEWYLLYDFNLKPGDGCFVYSPFTSYQNPTPYKTYVKCIGIEENFEHKDWRLLQLEEYQDASCSKLIGNGTWIKGISSLNGVLYNNRFGVDGVNSLLLDVSDNNKIIYSHQQTAISELTDTLIPNIRIQGLDVYISVDGNIKGSLYAQNGVHLGNYMFNQTPTHVKLSSKGVYVLQLENKSVKILVP